MTQRENAAASTGSILGESVRVFFKSIAFLTITLLFAIVVEWFGIFFGWWKESGVGHSASMVSAEMEYLNMAVKSNIFLDRQNALDEMATKSIVNIVQFTRIEQLMRLPFEFALVGIGSAINIVYVFLLRMTIMLFSMPTFIVFGVVGLTRGLVKREIRKWSGGRESSTMYHLYMQLIPITFVGVWFIYLSSPFTLNPFLVVGPAAILFGFVISRMAYRFKKYI